MAKSSILLPQWLQLDVQLLHIRDPSPRSRRLASESRSEWPSPQSCCRSGCSCMCSYCISGTHRRGAGGWRRNRGVNGQVLNLVAAVVAAVCAVIAYQGPIAEEQEVGVGIEE